MTEAGIKLSLRGLEKSFAGKPVLRGVDLDIREGESLVVIGASGSGKSVLVKTIIGLLPPDGGRIYIDGNDVTRLTGRARERVNRNVGMLFQGGALFDSLPLWENVAFGLLSRKGIRRKAARDMAVTLLGDVGLDSDSADRYPADLSAGAQKRVGLARAIAAQPEILFFDEPTTGLDLLMGEIIDRLIIRCVSELGATAITITHDMDSARRIGDRIVMLHEGRVAWAGDVDQIGNSGNPVVHQFVHGLVEGPIHIDGMGPSGSQEMPSWRAQ